MSTGLTGSELPYSEFSDMVERAEAEAVTLAVGHIAKGDAEGLACRDAVARAAPSR